MSDYMQELSFLVDKRCPRCEGSGLVESLKPKGAIYHTKQCPDCESTGFENADLFMMTVVPKVNGTTSQ